jgi:hypothetical protein
LTTATSWSLPLRLPDWYMRAASQL